jgi:hypothetical protein
VLSRAVVRDFSVLFRCFQRPIVVIVFHFSKRVSYFFLFPSNVMTAYKYPAGSSLALSFAPPTVHFDTSPAPDMYEEFTAFGDVMHVPGIGDDADNLEILVGLSSDALRDVLRAASDRVCRREWKERGGLDGALECDVCCVTSTTRIPNFMVFYTNASEVTGRSVTLCEACFGGTWMRLGRRVFQTIRPQRLQLMESAESLLWIAHQAELLRVSLGRGLLKLRGEMLPASPPGSGTGILVPVDGDLHRRVVEETVSLHFPGGQGRLLREGISDNKKKRSPASSLSLV